MSGAWKQMCDACRQVSDTSREMGMPIGRWVEPAGRQVGLKAGR